MASVALLIVFPFLMAYAAVRDLLTMLIPNTVSLLLLAGFALFAVATGLWGWDLMSHLGAGAVTLAVTFTLFALGKIGGGDAKLAAATAVWIGFDRLLEYLAVASLAGGALSLAILMARAHPLPPLLGRLPFALHLHDAKTGVPYGITLSFGALIVIPETMTWARMMAS